MFSSTDSPKTWPLSTILIILLEDFDSNRLTSLAVWYEPLGILQLNALTRVSSHRLRTILALVYV